MRIEIALPEDSHEVWTDEAVAKLVGQTVVLRLDSVASKSEVVAARKDAEGRVFVTIEQR